ncbi:MAG: 50S ribosomal protein L25 [Chlamydiia bacterium]|nr:50S ribosomal protein L25 [Chlamydiia bacterium]MCH9615126.1 50S ribosomal protein L25 [Chlamydiia bacterium]MCH9628552.1 50S ribosomal protein L25 [Chlamydiia bacterium]
MKLKTEKRSHDRKGELTDIRLKGDVPAVIYKAGGSSETITVDGPAFRKALSTMQDGHLPTTVFDLGGKKALVKEIQYHPSTYKILHVDFMELSDDRVVDVNVPVVCINQADCAGIKLGGFLRKVKRHVRVRCKPKDLPKAFSLDVKDMSIGDSLRAKHLDVNKNVELLVAEENVLAVVAKR